MVAKIRREGCGPLVAGLMLAGSVVATPIGPLVPVSPQVSMAAEGFHGNRGLVP
jgi:hypothetical protein